MLLNASRDPKSSRILSENPSPLHSQMDSILSTHVLSFWQYLPCFLPSFACAHSSQVHEKSCQNLIKVHIELINGKKYQIISKNLSKRCPKPSKMVGSEPGKATSLLNKAPETLPRRLQSSTKLENGQKILPQGFQNASKMTSACPLPRDHHDLAIITW